MLTKTFALMHRGLRHDARLLKVHLLRLGMVLIVVGMLFITQIQAMLMGSPGLDFFIAITWTTFFFATLAGGTFFATAITEEKEEQTLGLLALADIGPLALILGKSLPRLASALMILCALFPFTLLSITLGGVTWGQVWAAYWSLFAHVVFIGTIGLFCSALCRRSNWAIFLSVLLVCGFLFGPLIAQALVNSLRSGGLLPAATSGALQNAADRLAATSAIPRLSEIMDTGFDEGAFGFQVITNLCGALLLFALSWMVFVPSSRMTEASTPALPWLRRVRRKRASRRPWRWPLAWKDFHHLVGGPGGWLLRAAALIGLAILIAVPANSFRFDDRLRVVLGQTLMVVAPCAAALELLITASFLFPAEVKQGTLSSLVLLPTSIASTAYGKAAGALLGLLPTLACFALGGVIAIESVFEAFNDPDSGAGFVLFSVLFSLIWFVVLLHLTVLYSLLVNQWAAVPLAFLTMFVVNCFTGGVAMFPAMFIMAAAAGAGVAEVVVALITNTIYALVGMAICVGLQVMIGQRLRALAAAAG